LQTSQKGTVHCDGLVLIYYFCSYFRNYFFSTFSYTRATQKSRWRKQSFSGLFLVWQKSEVLTWNRVTNAAWTAWDDVQNWTELKIELPAACKKVKNKKKKTSSRGRRRRMEKMLYLGIERGLV